MVGLSQMETETTRTQSRSLLPSVFSWMSLATRTRDLTTWELKSLFSSAQPAGSAVGGCFCQVSDYCELWTLRDHTAIINHFRSNYDMCDDNPSCPITPGRQVIEFEIDPTKLFTNLFRMIHYDLVSTKVIEMYSKYRIILQYQTWRTLPCWQSVFSVCLSVGDPSPG